MLEKNFNLLFYLRKPKNYSIGPLPIYLRITVDTQRTEISTGRNCDIDKWNDVAGRMLGTREETKLLNAYLDTLQTKLYEVRRKLLEKDETVTAEALKNTLRGTNEKSKTVIEVFTQHNDQMKDLVGKDYSPTTLRRYKTSLDHTRAFIKWKYRVEDINIRKLNFDFICQYEFWFKTVRNCNHNTSIKYISNFRKIINSCVKKAWLDKDPFYGFKMTKKEVMPVFLTEEELEKISIQKFVSERINQVRDIFIFSCYTGLSFVDLKKLQCSEIRIGIDGSKWIFTRRQKTDTESKIPLLPVAMQILSKYENHPICIRQNIVLPVLSNQKYNEYLKEIANVSGINKHLTTHTARHTFATTVTLTNGVPIESVSNMLGHKNLRTTQHYAKVIDRKLSDDMNALKIKMEQKNNTLSKSPEI